MYHYGLSLPVPDFGDGLWFLGVISPARTVIIHTRITTTMDVMLANPYQNIGILILVALLRYRRQVGRLPRRFYARPWIRQRRQYGQYYRLMRELELGETYGNDYSR